MSHTVSITCTVNGEPVAAEVPTSATLADFIREACGLTGTKIACGHAVCGACTVHLDGVPVSSCSAYAFEADGSEIRTVEGLEDADGGLDPVQAAFADLSAFQCGYCTPGMIMLTRALLDRDPNPSGETIRKWLSSNICRCTGYELIAEAVAKAAEAANAGAKG